MICTKLQAGLKNVQEKVNSMPDNKYSTIDINYTLDEMSNLYNINDKVDKDIAELYRESAVQSKTLLDHNRQIIYSKLSIIHLKKDLINLKTDFEIYRIKHSNNFIYRLINRKEIKSEIDLLIKDKEDMLQNLQDQEDELIKPLVNEAVDNLLKKTSDKNK